MLLDKYETEGPSSRVVRPVKRGAVLTVGLRDALLTELRGTDWASTMRERRSVQAEGYVTLQRPPTAVGPLDTQQQKVLRSTKLNLMGANLSIRKCGQNAVITPETSICVQNLNNHLY